MHDFGEVVYMDLQKTGSTFVSQFMNHCCTLPLKKEIKHGRVKRRPFIKPFYFISVRQPLATYVSLYRYGLDRTGALYFRLEKQGLSKLYTNGRFADWLAFMLDPAKADWLGEDYGRSNQYENLGFLSFRFLMLALQRPVKTILAMPPDVDIVAFYEKKTMINHVVRNESLNADLEQLALHVIPRYFDYQKVKEFLARHDRVNTSTQRDVDLDRVPSELLSEVRRKERLLLHFYGSRP